MKKPTPEQLEKALEKATKKFLHRPSVTGVDIGFKYKGGKRTNDITLRVHVAEKFDPSQLTKQELIPKTIENVPVDVIQANYEQFAGKPRKKSTTAYPTPESTDTAEPEFLDWLSNLFSSNSQGRQSTLQPGFSIGNDPRNTIGTLGAIVFDRITGLPCILSNWHVLAPQGARHGDTILQPAAGDGGWPGSDTAGSLTRAVLDNRCDAAIATITNNRDYRLDQYPSGAVITNTRRPSIGDVLEKCGRTTSQTSGMVEGMGSYIIPYQGVGNKTIRGFKVVSQGNEVSQGGDSGSLWYFPGTNRGAGLHMAGDTSSHEEFAIACHLDTTLDALNCSLLPITSQPAIPVSPESLRRTHSGPATSSQSRGTNLRLPPTNSEPEVMMDQLEDGSWEVKIRFSDQRRDE